MRFVDMIERKADGFSLSEEEINEMVSGYVNGIIPDYQALISFLFSPFLVHMHRRILRRNEFRKCTGKHWNSSACRWKRRKSRLRGRAARTGFRPAFSWSER